MLLTGLTKENAGEYADFLTEDTAELIGREFICGFVLLTEEDQVPTAGIIWELGKGEEELDVVSRILFMKAKDEESADLLLEQYTEFAVAQECQNTSFELPATLGSDEKKALEKAGFSLESKEGKVVSIALADFGMALLKGDEKQSPDIKPLKELDERYFDTAIAEIDDTGNRGSLEDLPYLPMDYFENEISCYLEDEGDVMGLVLWHKRPSGKLDVNLLAGMEECTEADLKRLIKQAIMYAEEKYAPSTKCFVDRRNEEVYTLVKNNIPKAKGVQVYAGFRKEELPEPEVDEEFEDDEELEGADW